MNDLTLWIENSELDSGQIREACAPATLHIMQAGLTVKQAYEASLAIADGREYDPLAAAVWESAERIAMAGVSDERAILSVA